MTNYISNEKGCVTVRIEIGDNLKAVALRAINSISPHYTDQVVSVVREVMQGALKICSVMIEEKTID